MSSMDKEAVELPCLGRPFQLGMLYDMRTEFLVPGVTLWDNSELQKHKHVTPNKFTLMDVSASDSLEDKAALMDISGSLKLSVLSGKVNVEGSAKYLNDNKKSSKQSRITLIYNVNTHFEHLTMDHLASERFKYCEVFDSDLGTHVVTGVLYGANAFFVFSRDLDSNEDKTKIEGSFKVALSNLSCFGISVECGASGKLNESEKSVIDKFSCTFYGDFTLPANPLSFEGAIEMYKQLPHMLGERGENTVPLKVWLYPLTKLDSKAAKCVRDVRNDLITATSDVIESLNIAEMRCNDLVVDTAAQTFPAFHQKVQDMKENCCQYKLDLLKKVGSLLPLIHGGQQEEGALADLLKAHEESPFSSAELDRWIKIKEEEADVLKAFLENLECPAQDVYKSIVFPSSLTENVVFFTFTSLEGPDPFLDYLSDYMKETQRQKPNKPKQIKPSSWLTPDIGQSMRKKLKLFKYLKSSSKSDQFIVVSQYDEDHHKNHPGACIMVYGDECDKPLCFTPPSKPICSATGAVTNSSVTVKLSPACEPTVTRNLEIKMKQEEEWKSRPLQQNEEEITLTGLKSGTVYEVRGTAVDILGMFPVTSDVITIQTPKGTDLPTDQTPKGTDPPTDQTAKGTDPPTDQTPKGTDPPTDQTPKGTDPPTDQTAKCTDPPTDQTPKATDPPTDQSIKHHQHQSPSSRTVNTHQWQL